VGPFNAARHAQVHRLGQSLVDFAGPGVLQRMHLLRVHLVVDPVLVVLLHIAWEELSQ